MAQNEHDHPARTSTQSRTTSGTSHTSTPTKQGDMPDTARNEQSPDQNAPHDARGPSPMTTPRHDSPTRTTPDGARPTSTPRPTPDRTKPRRRTPRHDASTAARIAARRAGERAEAPTAPREGTDPRAGRAIATPPFACDFEECVAMVRPARGIVPSRFAGCAVSSPCTSKGAAIKRGARALKKLERGPVLWTPFWGCLGPCARLAPNDEVRGGPFLRGPFALLRA